MIETMVDYKDRLTVAMSKASKGPHDLAKALGMSYTGAKKAMEGGKDGKSVLTAANNSKAAKWLGVSSDWLATGEGEMRPPQAWPFPLVDRERYEPLSPEMRGYVQKAMNDALDYCEKMSESATTAQHAGQNVIHIPPNPSESSLHKTRAQKRGRGSEKKNLSE